MPNATPPDPPPSPTRGALFSRRGTWLFRAAIILFGCVLLLAGASDWTYYHSPYRNGIGLAPDQPVLFSHRHHARELRIDCRYCHATVETSAFAGLPDTHTCLTCHSQLFTDTPMLAPVVASAVNHHPLHWQRVNNVPDFVFFNHSAHLSQGIACARCHGDVAAMPLTAKARSLDMRWCVDCHREAAAPGGVHDPARAHLTNCSTCHH